MEQPLLQPTALLPAQWLFLQDDINALLQQHTNLAAKTSGFFQALLGNAVLQQKLAGLVLRRIRLHPSTGPENHESVGW